MEERITADIAIYQGNDLLMSVPITPESRRVRKLMESDYIELDFKSDEPVNIPIGAYLTDKIFGRFYVTEEQMPSFDSNLHSYNFKIRFDAHYYRWQKYYICMLYTLGGSYKRTEKIWTLTTNLRNQMREFMKNLQSLGYVSSELDFDNESVLDTYVIIDDTVETKNQSLTMSYSSTYMLDGLKTMADTWKCEYWITGDKDNFQIHFGTCSKGEEVTISLDEYIDNGEIRPANTQNMSFSKDSSSGSANVLYYFGGTENIPNTYRKELRLKAKDIVVIDGKIQRFNGYKTFGGTDEYLDLYKYIVKGVSASDANQIGIEFEARQTVSYLLKATNSSVTDESRIETVFRNYDTSGTYSSRKIRRLMGIRVCAAVKTTDGKIIRIFTAEDAYRVNSMMQQVTEVRAIAEVALAEFNGGYWEVVDYAPIALTLQDWKGLVNSGFPLSYLHQYDNTHFVFESFKYLNGTSIHVGLPSGQTSSSYLVYYGVSANVKCDEFKLTDAIVGFTYLPLAGYIPNKNNCLNITSVNTSLYCECDGEPYYPRNASELYYYLLSYINKEVTFYFKANKALIALQWDMMANDASVQYFNKANNNYTLKFLTDKTVVLTPLADGKGYSYKQKITQTDLNKFNDDLYNDIVKTGYSVAFTDTVWALQSDNTRFSYYKGENMANSGSSLICTLDTASGSEGYNLIEHIQGTNPKKNAATLGFCPNVNLETAQNQQNRIRGIADISIPEQEVEIDVDFDWGDIDFDTATFDIEMYVAVGLSDKSSGRWGYGRIGYSAPPPKDHIALYYVSQKYSVTKNDSSRQQVTLNIPQTLYHLDDEGFWSSINKHQGSEGFLPYVIFYTNVSYEQNGREVVAGQNSVALSLPTNSTFNFSVIDYKSEMDYALIIRQAEDYVIGGGDNVRTIDISSAGIDAEILDEGDEFVIYTAYDYKIPYKWYTSDLDNPSSLLSIGDRHLQLPVINKKSFDKAGAASMGFEIMSDVMGDGGKMFIARHKRDSSGNWIATEYEDMVYCDGSIIPYDSIKNPDKYPILDEKCVINENIYPMAIMLIMRQDNKNLKGIFTEAKKWYQEVEGESSENRVYYEWQQYHINIGLPMIEEGRTVVKEQVFSKDYILQNSEPLKIRFLIPEDLKSMIGTDVAQKDFNDTISKNCKLAGMTFEVDFRESTTYNNQTHTQDYAIARNEDFGAKLPNEILRPSYLDPCVLVNWNVKTMSAMGLIYRAEYRLLDKAFEYYKAMHDNNFTITADMMSDYVLYGENYVPLTEQDDKILVEQEDKILVVKKDIGLPEIGQKVNILHKSLKGGEKHTRILGYEMKLDKPYDTPKITMGESDATSRIKRLEKELTKLS